MNKYILIPVLVFLTVLFIPSSFASIPSDFTHHWAFNLNLTDYNNTVNLQATTPSYGIGKFANATYQSNSANNRVYNSTASPIDYNALCSGFAISLWVNLSTVSNAAYYGLFYSASKDPSTANYRQYGIDKINSNPYDFRFFFQGNAATANVASTITPTANAIYHIVGTFDGTKARIYVNNVLKTTSSAITCTGNSGAGSYNETSIGGYGVGSPGGYYSGWVDSVYTYHRNLTALDVENLYNATSDYVQTTGYSNITLIDFMQNTVTTPYNVTVNGNTYINGSNTLLNLGSNTLLIQSAVYNNLTINITFSGNGTTYISGLTHKFPVGFSNAYIMNTNGTHYIDANNTIDLTKINTVQTNNKTAYINYSYTSSTNNALYNLNPWLNGSEISNQWTISVKFSFNSVVDGYQSWVLDNSVSGSNGTEIFIAKDDDSSSNYSIIAGVWGGGSNEIELNNNGIKPTANTWYHLILRYNGTSLSMYIDGRKVDENSSSLPYGLKTPQNGVTLYGVGVPNPTTLSGGMSGNISSVYIYKKALSDGGCVVDSGNLCGGEIETLYYTPYEYNTYFINYTYATITAKDFYTNTTLNEFYAYINGVYYNTTNGTITYLYDANTTTLANITIGSNYNGGFFNNTYTNYNLTSTLNALLSQSIVYFIARDALTNTIISGATFNTSIMTNNTHYFNNSNYNITANAAGYTSQTIQYNVTPYLNTTYTFYLNPTYTLNISSNTYGTAPRLLRYTALITNEQYSYTNTQTTTNGILNISLSPLTIYNITIYSYQTNESHLNITFYNYNISQNLAFNYTVLNITAKDNLTGATLGNITQTISSTNLSGAIAQRTNTANPAIFFTSQGLNYTLSTSATGYNTLFYNIENLNNGIYNYTANLTANNSIYFTFIDASTLNIILSSVTVNINLGNTTLYNCTTSTGNCLISNIIPNNYTLVISSTGYNILNGLISVGNNTYQSYIAYMNLPTSLNTVFTITSQQTLEPINNAIVSIESRTPSNTTYVFINTLYSDITGSVILNYNASLYYRITVTATNYEVNTFELKPIIYTSYEVRLRQNISVNVSDAYQSVSVQRSPGKVRNNQIANFTYFISAPSGNLVYYNYTIFTSYNNSILLQGSGTNAYGNILNDSLYINTTNLNASIYMATSYMLSNGFVVSFLNIIPVEGTAADYTSVGAGGDRFNLSLFDRVIILLFVILLSGGMAFYFGGITPGAAMSTLVLSYFTATQFITPWIGIPSIVLLIIFMMRPN